MMLNDYTVYDKELRVTMSMRFESEDLGKQTSSTESAHKGIKPKEFSVSLIIPFVDSDRLSELLGIAESVEADGGLTIYDITDSTANAVGVRQVRFADNFTAREAQNLKAWQVAFSLQEYQSIAEKVEQRQTLAEPSTQSAEGVFVFGVDSAGEQPPSLASSNWTDLQSYFDKTLT